MPRREAQADQPCPRLDLGAQPAGPWQVHVCCLSPRRAVCCSASTFTKTSYGPWQFHISSTTVTLRVILKRGLRFPQWKAGEVSGSCFFVSRSTVILQSLKRLHRRVQTVLTTDSCTPRWRDGRRKQQGWPPAGSLRPGVPSPHPKWRSCRREGESLPSEFQGETPADAGVAERSCDPASSGEHEEVVYVQWPESKEIWGSTYSSQLSLSPRRVATPCPMRRGRHPLSILPCYLGGMREDRPHRASSLLSGAWGPMCKRLQLDRWIRKGESISLSSGSAPEESACVDRLG